MKKTALIIFLLVGSLSSYAQGSLAEGGKRLNAGFGFSNYGTPVYVGLDLGITDAITLGPQISYRRYGQKFLGTNYNQNLIVISLNGDYHFNSLLELPSEFDVYAGLNIGYYIWSDNNNLNGATFQSSGIGLAAQIGGRYFFSENLAVNLEFGGGTASGGKVGITYQF
jgi:outer membrane immunogenic protein